MGALARTQKTFASKMPLKLNEQVLCKQKSFDLGIKRIQEMYDPAVLFRHGGLF